MARVWRKLCRIVRRPLKANASALASKNSLANTPHNAIPHGPLSGVYGDACRAFVPQPYDRPVVLLWPRDEPPQSRRGPAGGWDKVCTQISVVEVPGHHHSCISLNANVAQVGHAMRKAIEQAEGVLTST
jgi:thioesterase domain-containing protein